jgi:hypothetical protein
MATAAHEQPGVTPGASAPQQELYELVTGHYISRAIYVAAKLGIADLLRNGPQPYTRIAELSKTHPDSLRRVLVLLASAGVLFQEGGEAFGLTAMGEYLRSDVPGSRRSQALLLASPVQQRSWSGLLDIVRTGKPPSGKSTFQFLEKYPEEAAIFNEGMTAGSADVAAAVAAVYDFSPFRMVVDIGGGHGVLLQTILNKNGSLHGIVFDAPDVAEGARRAIQESGLAERCEAIGGDFFGAVPGLADVYILKSVIHDWDDERSVAILNNVHAAMAQDARLLLVELVLPDHVDATVENRIAAGSDLNMLVNLGGRERTESDFAALLIASGFRLSKVLPTKTAWRVIEGIRCD